MGIFACQKGFLFSLILCQLEMPKWVITHHLYTQKWQLGVMLEISCKLLRNLMFVCVKLLWDLQF